MSETKSRMRRLMDGLRHAFSTASPYGPLSDEDRDLLKRLAVWIVKRKMSLPAILFLESVKPLSAISSQAMVFLKPFNIFFKPEEYSRIAEIMERREGIGVLVETIEAAREKLEGVVV